MFAVLFLARQVLLEFRICAQSLVALTWVYQLCRGKYHHDLYISLDATCVNPVGWRKGQGPWFTQNAIAVRICVYHREFLCR